MNNLLHFKFKIIGIIIFAVATVFSIIVLAIGSFDNLMVFNFTSNSESSTLIFGPQNIFSTITSIVFIVGFSLIVFSKEKNEIHYLKSIRIKALVITSVAFIILGITSILINSFLGISLLFLNFILPFIIYLSLFYSSKKREQKKMKYQIIQKKIIHTNSIIQNKNKKI